MINKIEKITSIGKFRNYTAVGQVNFHKLTTIYGDNGGGKTTLTSVLRSLGSNNEKIVRSRISTNHTHPQAAQITCSQTAGLSHHTFGSAGWNTSLDNIEIFDIHFVNENVYSGFEFKDDHKKQLHKFVLGAQGVGIQQQIEQNKINKAALTLSISTAEQQLIAQVGNNLSPANISTFLAFKTTQAVNVDNLISDADAALITANSNSTIATLSQLSQVNSVLPEFDFDLIITNLSASTQTVQDAVLKQLVETHCEHLTENGLEGAENWLKQGFNTIQSLSAKSEPLECPFCRKSLDANIDIIRAYTNLFDESFNELINKIETDASKFEAINIDNITLSTNTACDSNDSHVASWSVHLPAGITAPVNNLIADDEIFKNAYTKCIQVIQLKLRNPTTVIDYAPITEFCNLIQDINDNVNAYNQSVRSYNASITSFMATIQTIQQAQSEVFRLEQIKKRFEPSIAAICSRRATDKTQLAALQLAYTQLSQQQQTSVTSFFDVYKIRVNHYLKDVFKTHFQVDNVTHIPPQGRAMEGKMGYKLVIDGKDISFEPDQPFSAKECLSEGDKTTIALAFFLSKLDVDPNRADKILVFDDPLSSLDTNRRMYTIGLIRGVVNQMKQVIVLSHNEHFLYEICKDFRNVDKKNLRITENFVAKESVIEVCDLDELVKSEYFKQLEAVINFRTAPNHLLKDQVLGWLRNVLEGHLNFKFYRVLSSMPGQKTFGNQIKYLRDQGTPFRDDSNRLTIIANLNLINSIAWKPHHGDPMPDYSALGINPNSITPAELDNLIQDTLDLIDTQL